MEHRGSGVVVDSSLITVSSVTRSYRSTVYAVYIAYYHTLCKYLEYKYQIAHATPSLPQ